ncbi:MAG: CPBP family intramembrane glutamic endopeptidase [Ilumatobacteraceae bacterium]
MIAAGNVVRSTVLSSAMDLPFNVALAGGVVAIASAAGLGTEELGLARRHFASGARWGGAAFASVTAVVVGAAAVPATSGLFDDDRADIGIGELVVDVVLRIPVGTVLVEEVVFRGAILGLLCRLTSVRRAVLGSSLMFGVWHALPAWTSKDDNSNVAVVADSAHGGVLVVVGTVLATTVAGVVFCWLRRRSGSLLAPILAHLATNIVPLVAAWTLAR